VTNPNKCRVRGCRGPIDVFPPDGRGLCDKHYAERLDKMEADAIKKLIKMDLPNAPVEQNIIADVLVQPKSKERWF